MEGREEGVKDGRKEKRREGKERDRVEVRDERVRGREGNR